ncbi:MAG: ABC transporter permease, partial [Alcanivoracaceae bacterium]
MTKPRVRSLAIWLLAVVMASPVLVVAASWLAGVSGNWQHLLDTVLPVYLANSVVLALGTGTGTLLVGTASAWAVARFSFPGHGTLSWALLLPMACPAYLLAYTWTGLLAPEGLLQQALALPLPDIRSLPGAIAMLTLVLYPYIYLMARSAFIQQSAVALDVARSLGAGPWRRFFRVALPLARPAIIAGLALVLMETLADYGTVQYFGVPTLSTGIYRTWFGLGDINAAAQMASALLLAMVLLLWVERFARQRRAITDSFAQRASRSVISGWRGWAVTAALCLPVLFGFLLPALQLLAWSAPQLDSALDSRFFGLLGNSLLIATLTTACAVGIGLLLIYARRLVPDTLRRHATRLASFGYAVPGTVLAVGVVLALGST